MDPRPTNETIQNLRLTLQTLEQQFESVDDEPAMAELKRILLIRIADLEAAEALEPADREVTDTPAPADLTLAAMTEAAPRKDAVETAQLDKPD
jgi:hypothetical protein